MLTDANLPAYAAKLGIPGFVDIHSHFMPQPVLDKVWAYFDAAGTGAEWPIVYRFDEATRLATIRHLGVVRFTSLNYAHKPDMAAWLNEWNAAFAAANPDCAHSATFFPEEGVETYVAAVIEGGARVFKLHLVVGNYDPWDPVLHPVWAMIEEAQIPVVIHVGAFPYPTQWTGAGRLGEILAAHPDLVLVIAHLGMPDYEELWELGLRYANVHWDTTMSLTDFTLRLGPTPEGILEGIAAHPERIVLGTDFPNIPHEFAHQVEALRRLGLGDDWLRKVLFENGARLLRCDSGDQPVNR